MKSKRKCSYVFQQLAVLAVGRIACHHTSIQLHPNLTTINIQTANRVNKIRKRFLEAEWCGKLFQMKVFCAAIDSVKFSSKSELSSRFSGRLKFSALFEYLSLSNRTSAHFLGFGLRT